MTNLGPFDTVNLELDPGDRLEFHLLRADEVQHNDYVRRLDHQVDIRRDGYRVGLVPNDGEEILWVGAGDLIEVARVIPG